MKESSSYSQTAGRALEVVCLFQKYDKLTLSQVVQLTGFSMTIAYRLLYTLTCKGFLKQDTVTKAYTLGDTVLLLGYAAMRTQDIKTLARPFLRKLTCVTELESFLSICVGQESLCLDKEANGEELQAAIHAGSVSPLHKGATNRILLAFLPEEERAAYLDKLREPADMVAKLTEELEVIRRRGYDFSTGQLSKGLFSIAYPILGENGRLLASISIGGPAFGITDELKEKYRVRVKDAARSLSRLSGAGGSYVEI